MGQLGIFSYIVKKYYIRVTLSHLYCELCVHTCYIVQIKFIFSLLVVQIQMESKVEY